MKIKNKIEPAKAAIRFITQHDDEPYAVREAAANRLKAFIDAELADAKAREVARAKEFGGGDEKSADGAG